MTFRRMSWLIAMALIAGVSLARADLAEDLETMGKILAIPNTRAAQQLQVSLPEIGVHIGGEFLPGDGRRSFGRSLMRVVWLRHSTADELEMVDIWGRELRIRIPRYMGDEKIRFKPVSTKGILEAMATEYKALSALPADPEQPIDVSGGLGLAVHLYRRDEKAAAAQVIRWCQQLDRRRLGALTLDALPVCYGGQYAFAWQRVEVYGDWHRYRSFCEDFLDRPQADRWQHTPALRALMPQIQVMAAGPPPAPERAVGERNFELLLKAMDAPKNELPTDDWPIAILGDARATSYRKRNRDSELRKELYKQDIGAIPYLARLLDDRTLVPLAAVNAADGFRTPLTRGQVARRLLLATLPADLPATISDADLAVAAMAYSRKSRPFRPIERAVQLAEAAPARFDRHVYQMLVEALPHDRTDAIDGILARAVGTDGATTMAADYLEALGDDYRAPLDRYLAAYRGSLAADTMTPALLEAAVRTEHAAVLKRLARESLVAALELVALDPSAPNRPPAELTQALARDDGRLLRDVLRYLGNPRYRAGWADLIAAVTLKADEQATDASAAAARKRLRFRDLRPEWRAAVASQEQMVLGNSMVVPLGQFLAMHLESTITGTDPSPYVLFLQEAREAVRQRVLAQIEGLTGEMLPPMPLATAVPPARRAVLTSQLQALEAAQVSAWLTALQPAERMWIAETEASGTDMEAVAKLAAHRRWILDVQVHPEVAAEVPPAILQQWLGLVGTTLSSDQVDAVEETMHGRSLQVSWRGLGGSFGTILLIEPNILARNLLKASEFDRRWFMIGSVFSVMVGVASDAWESPEWIVEPADGDAMSARLAKRLRVIPPEQRERFQEVRQRVVESDEDWWPSTVLELLSFAYTEADAAAEAEAGDDQGEE